MLVDHSLKISSLIFPENIFSQNVMSAAVLICVNNKHVLKKGVHFWGGKYGTLLYSSLPTSAIC